jgi:hypothetical protein
MNPLRAGIGVLLIKTSDVGETSLQDISNVGQK